MLDLSNTILIAISSSRIEETQKAIDHCLSQCEFKDILFFTDNQNAKFSINIDKICSIKDYDKFVLKKLPILITGKAKYYITIHWDGFIVNTNAWNKDFLLYDYIGAPWPWYGNICGNGGFCIKSQKFIDSQIKILDLLDISYPDDFSLCINSRQDFTKLGCNFAPNNIAYQFSTEYGDYSKYNSFGFHNFNYHPQFKHIIS